MFPAAYNIPQPIHSPLIRRLVLGYSLSRSDHWLGHPKLVLGLFGDNLVWRAPALQRPWWIAKPLRLVHFRIPSRLCSEYKPDRWREMEMQWESLKNLSGPQSLKSWRPLVPALDSISPGNKLRPFLKVVLATNTHTHTSPKCNWFLTIIIIFLNLIFSLLQSLEVRRL